MCLYMHADIDMCATDLHNCGKHQDCIFTGLARLFSFPVSVMIFFPLKVPLATIVLVTNHLSNWPQAALKSKQSMFHHVTLSCDCHVQVQRRSV